MGQQYSPQKLVRQVGRPLLRRYFGTKKLLAKLDWAAVEEGKAGLVVQAMSELTLEQQRGIDADFTLVSELADENGSILIAQEVDGMDTRWESRLSEMRNDYERAFLVLLEKPELLELLFDYGEMDRFGAARWIRRQVGKGLRPRRDEKALEQFEEAVAAIFRPQGRGRLCHVDVHDRRNPNRICFFAYPEDFTKMDQGYDDSDKFTRHTRRTALEMIFVYRPEDGQMEFVAPGSAPLTEELARAFCTTILGLTELPPRALRSPYDLARLKNRGFSFPTDAADNIERVEVRQLRFELPGGGDKCIVVSAKPSRHHRHSVHDVLDQAIDQDRLPLSALDVTQATISMKFRASGAGRGKTLTFAITAPDRCNLKDTGRDATAKRYLRTWGIERG